MISRIIKKTVDLSKIQKVDQLEGPLYQLENGGHTFEITCLMDGAAASVSGTVSARFLRADEETVYFTGSLTGNVVSITLPQSCYVSNGRFGLVVFVAGNDITSAVYAVAGSVYRSTSDHIIDPTEEIPSLEDLIAKIEECEEATADAQQAASFVPSIIASTYSTSVAYVVGDYCTYEGALYRCTAETDGAFDPADWEAVKVGTEFQNVNGQIDDLKSAIDYIVVTSLDETLSGAEASPTGWKLKDDGLCEPDSSAKLAKYKVVAGNVYKFVSDYKAQFQTVASVPQYSPSNRVGITYGVGTFTVTAPQGATYLILSTTVSGSTACVYTLTPPVPDNFFTPYHLEWESGKAYNTAGNLIDYSGYSAAKIDISIFQGETITGTVGLTPDGPAIGFIDANGVLIDSWQNTTAGQYKFSYELTVPDTAKWFFISKRDASEDIYAAPSVTYNGVFAKINTAYGYAKPLDDIDKLVGYEMVLPPLRNGSVGNTNNANMVTTNYVLPINHNYDYMRVDFLLDESSADTYGFAGAVFSGATDGQTTSEAMSASGVTKVQFNNNVTETQSERYKYYDLANWRQYDHVSFAAWRSKNGTAVPIRIANDPNAIRISYYSAPKTDDADSGDVEIQLKNARHIKWNTVTPLTLLHFSDIHADTGALSRIIKDAEEIGNIDNIICTGDMVLNNATQITSWWNPDVMTCIGNHDSASYSDGTYDWTALSMADRDAYYITPFKSNWGITHTSGTSYYYKDYTAQKVRLIVMDVMLYTDNGAEATAQTAWLSNLLSSAITNNLHVLIAIHAPHGGAVAEDCSFSRYGQTAMPPLPDCDTPQTVIDAVTAAINNGLHFIGYLVGHTHQDNIWDAEGDGKQLMYCITCAIVSQEAQWKNSDQYRGTDADAYNLVTIDTANTLVKIVRGGGADIDDHMRTRQAICINYSTGTVVGEVL